MAIRTELVRYRELFVVELKDSLFGFIDYWQSSGYRLTDLEVLEAFGN